MKKFIWIASLIYCLNGFGHIIIGTVLEPMVDSYGIHYKDGGQLIMNQFLGFLGGVMFAPLIVNRVGRRMTIFLALLMFALSQFVFSILPNWNVMLAIAPFGGAGIGIAETIVASLIIGHLKEKKASTLVIVEVFFGVGALVIPVVSAFLILTGVWNFSFTFVAVFTTVIMLLWLFLSFGELDPVLKRQSKPLTEDGNKPARKRYSTRQLPIIATGALFFFMYVGTEMVLPNYLPTIMSKTTSLDASTLALSITVFWAAMTLGRISMTGIIDRIGYSKLFVICCIGQFITLLMFAYSTSAMFSFISIFLTGLLMGGVFSIGLLIVNETSKGLEEWTTSILMAMGGLGGAFLPRIAGELIDRYPISVTLWSLVLCAFILGCLMAVIFYFRKKAMDVKGLQPEKANSVV
ncbi:MFS transporter [Sporosarcina sp. YIM B06819]|uniref:MFS transporter n=1 Tax=Sporosarcina sp. YIM B06819 TaxID=3081769 RepID=UPI00298BFD34|nr:MFS transporter [Sporosarcina sp. YIM B06819]